MRQVSPGSAKAANWWGVTGRPGLSPREAAVRLFYVVRERLRYNPWRVRYTPADYTASGVVLRDPGEGGHCIDKVHCGGVGFVGSRDNDVRERCQGGTSAAATD